MQIVFWQRMFSPHMMGLAEAMAERGHRVVFVANEELSQARRQQGWQVAPGVAVERRIIDSVANAEAFIGRLPPSTVHITQGLRGNAEIRKYQDRIVESGQRLWAIMETVASGGWRAPLKRALYRREIYRRRSEIEGILAIGAGTADWLSALGFPGSRVYPFAYFIAPVEGEDFDFARDHFKPFTFAFVGNLTPWKNPKLALDAFLGLSTGERRFLVVGDGPLRARLETCAKGAPEDAEIKFLGRLPMANVPLALNQVDCLLLPSNVDGWGVVASEAMLIGTPVIVSDACGVRSAVQSAPEGAVFPATDLAALTTEMNRIQCADRDPARREKLKTWAQPLAADFGAEYLEHILLGVPLVRLPEWLRRAAGVQR